MLFHLYVAVEYRKDNINVVTVGASGEIEDQSTAVKKFYPGEKCEVTFRFPFGNL